MEYSIPVIVNYDGEKYSFDMGPFERSLEREFALSIQQKAIKDCTSTEQLREVSGTVWGHAFEDFRTFLR